MQTDGIQRSAPNLVAVCVDRVTPGGFAGRLYDCYSASPTPFSDPSELLRGMDALFDLLDYPQRTVAERSFLKRPPQAAPRKAPARPPRVADPTANAGELATFVVHVMYRQNATWQGSVLWEEAQERQNFRSALELIKLIAGALETRVPIQASPQSGE
jgi:hypothetical protein